MFKARYTLKENENEYNLTIQGTAIFSNLMGFKNAFSQLKAGKKVGWISPRQNWLTILSWNSLNTLKKNILTRAYSDSKRLRTVPAFFQSSTSGKKVSQGINP